MQSWSETWCRMVAARRQVEDWLREDSPPAPVSSLQAWIGWADEIRNLLITAEYGWSNAIDVAEIDLANLPFDHPCLYPGKMETPRRARLLLEDMEYRINAARDRASSAP